MVPATPSARPPAAWYAQRWVAPALIALLAFVGYANTLGAGLFFDDRPAVVDNVWVRQGAPLSILSEPSWWGPQMQVKAWRPLTTLTFALNYALHGYAPFGYHAVNVGLHVAVSLLVLVVLTRLAAPTVAVPAALLFAVHPVHTDAVASVVGRAELLAAAGFLLAWWSFSRADEARRAATAGGGSGSPLVHDVAGVGFFIAALLAKEMAFTLPVVLVLADVLGSAPGTVKTTLRGRLPRYVVLAGVMAAFVMLRARITGHLALPIPPLDNPLVMLPTAQRWMTAIAVVGLYAWRLVFPLHLAADYSAWQIVPVTTPLDPRFCAGMVVLLAVPAVAWRSRRSAPMLTLGLGLMAIAFALISNLPFLIATIMAERWLYLPSIGFCLACGAWLGRFATTGGRWPMPLTVALGVLLMLATARTYTRNAVWHDPARFFTAMVEDSPGSSRAHASFADVLADDGRLDDAVRSYQRALTIEPKNWLAHYNLGNTQLKRGDVGATVAAYEATLALEPTYAKAMINLGAAETRRGNATAAIDWLRRAIVAEPDATSAHTSLANVLAATGDRAGARTEYEAARAIDPRSADVLADYGSFLAQGGEHAAAIALLRQSIALRPGVPERHYNLANELIATNDLAGAASEYQRAIALQPTFAPALENLGNTLSQQGDHRAALEWLRRAERAGGTSPRLTANIANEIARLGQPDDGTARAPAQR